jgi:hypothetical protein
MAAPVYTVLQNQACSESPPHACTLTARLTEVVENAFDKDALLATDGKCLKPHARNSACA